MKIYRKLVLLEQSEYDSISVGKEKPCIVSHVRLLWKIDVVLVGLASLSVAFDGL